MIFSIDTEQEADGRWIAEIPDLPGALVYGATREEAIQRVQALALRVMADRPCKLRPAGVEKTIVAS